MPPEVCQERLLSRRSSQRLARKQRARSDLREAVRALNWMNGFSPQEESVGLPDPMQSQVIGRAEYLCKLAEESGTFSDRLGEEAALRALLQGRTEYDTPDLPVSLARFNIERISLPGNPQGVARAGRHVARGGPSTFEFARAYVEAGSLGGGAH